MKIIVTSPSFGKFNPDIYDELQSEGYEVVKLIPYDRQVMLQEVVDADAIIVGLETMDEEIMATGKQLKIITKHGVGVDNIDLDAAMRCGIAVSNTPGTNNDAVADLAFGLMLSVARSIPDANSNLKEEKWLRYDGNSVWGKTLGIVGLGAIGKGVAKRAKGFSMDVLGYDITEPTQEEVENGINRVSLVELFQQADYISLHVPLNKFTKHMVGKEQFDMMKDSAILINTARGGLIDEEELKYALLNNRIKGCGLDVFDEEPPTNYDLLKLDNLVVTPHMAAYTIEAVQLTSETAANNVRKALKNEGEVNVVN
ncbi:hydroxyacid dehydrogenase [Gracilibacillus salitolerans]|uniref:Hydroxyacid dehydrogenase n=1 Tax=Gracilibacillus salitolerans TaxID=2663022 RepID=A0A5Q2THA2_9BACI|nr:phosphoglycerate dehydrogenase [Gracilibacillus salitolerans]QGH33511.1 hydroxyacid dehydrogenase [Gracilibacillus salitolerans]